MPTPQDQKNPGYFQTLPASTSWASFPTPWSHLVLLSKLHPLSFSTLPTAVLQTLLFPLSPAYPAAYKWYLKRTQPKKRTCPTTSPPPCTKAHRGCDSVMVSSLTPLLPCHSPFPVSCNLTTPVPWPSFPLCGGGNRILEKSGLFRTKHE